MTINVFVHFTGSIRGVNSEIIRDLCYFLQHIMLIKIIFYYPVVVKEGKYYLPKLLRTL